jgi:hypothetical protein
LSSNPGPIPSGGISCMILIMQAQAGGTWKAGNYSSSTEIPGYQSSYSDAVCNSGGTISSAQFTPCSSGKSPYWPDQITTDMKAANLTQGKCNNDGSITDIIPLYISVNSGCSWGGNGSDAATCFAPNQMASYNLSAPPTSSGDTLNGVQLSGSVANKASYGVVVNASAFIGGIRSNSSCWFLTFPVFTLQ